MDKSAECDDTVKIGRNVDCIYVGCIENDIGNDV